MTMQACLGLCRLVCCYAGQYWIVISGLRPKNLQQFLQLTLCHIYHAQHSKMYRQKNVLEKVF